MDVENLTLSEGKALEKTAVALGIFDGLHRGHLAVLSRIFERKDLEPAVFTFKSSTVSTKSGGLLLTDEEKLRRLDEMGVKYVYCPDFSDLRELSPRDFVRQVLVGILNAEKAVCGEDFSFGKGGKAGAEELSQIAREFGISVEIVPLVRKNGEAVGSRDIKALIAKGEIERANELSGERFYIREKVVSGNHIGRTLDFPTINQIYPESLVKPPNGVYSTLTEADGKTYKSITNIGTKPTVTDSDLIIAETNILGYSGDLYGKTVSVYLLGFLRSERKFGSLSELKIQIEEDIRKRKDDFNE